MNWFKHTTNERNELASKVIKKKFGAAGYGIFLSLLEVIGENCKSDNTADWGHVDALHTMETLADECACTVAELHTFLEFCNDKHIFERHDDRLYCPIILDRLNEYSEKLRRKTRSKRVRKVTDKCPTDVGKVSDDCRKSVGTEEEEENKKRREIEEEEKRPVKPESSLAYLRNIPLPDVDEFTKTYQANQSQVRLTGETLANYCDGHGKKYANYKAMLRNALAKDFGKRKQQQQPTPPKEPENFQPVSPDVLAAFRKKAHETIGGHV